MDYESDHQKGCGTSFIVPAYNEEACLDSCLGSIRSACEEVGLEDWEIVVCDNNSTDQTPDVAAAQGARVVYEPYNQISRARNRGAAEAKGAYLVFVDADSQVTPELVCQTIEALEMTKACGGGTEIALSGETPKLLLRGVLRAWTCCSRVFKVAAGSYVFCRRQAWEDVGGVSEELYAGEELAFSREVRRWGRVHGMPFCILRHCPVYTSPRKFHWYTPWALCRQCFTLLKPGALKKRGRCFMWYQRPGQ